MTHDDEPLDLIEEIEQILRDLLDEIGAATAQLTTGAEDRVGTPARTVPLGGHEFLRLDLGERSASPHDDEAIERAARNLREARRRHHAERLPPLTIKRAAGHASPHAAVRARIRRFLQALVAIDGVTSVQLVLRDELLDAEPHLDANAPERWRFINRQVIASPTAGSSHGELRGDDFYAATFWYGASLIVMLEEVVAEDFIRLRARQVIRELSQLLPELEPEPTSPAVIAPRPS